MQAALLPERGVVKVAGADARHFLNGLATTDIGKVAPGAPRFGALLTPQGKIIVDFIVVEALPEDGSGFFLDCPKALVQPLVEKLTFYRLRAKVTVDDLSDRLGVMAYWGGAGLSEYGLCYADPRLAALGMRIIVPPELATETAADLGAALVEPEVYHAHRIALGVPRGGQDFTYNDAFPHEADMDQLAGVDFDKGCYVGQEVVSRVEHRSTARSRVVPVVYDGGAPMEGATVMVGDKQIGVMGSSANGHGLALLRLDRVGDALQSATRMIAAGVPITLAKPDWATFAWPGEDKASS